MSRTRRRTLSPLRGKIAEQIVVSFHQQFAENQNHHQKLFLQVLAVLVTVLVGFGYLYLRTFPSPINGDLVNFGPALIQVKAEPQVIIETLYLFLTLAMTLLSMAIAIVGNMAYGFRRDQLAAANIRVRAGVLTPGGNKSNYDNYFFPTFNPIDNDCWFTWMPGFHIIFYWFLLAVKTILILGVVFHPSQSLISLLDIHRPAVFCLATFSCLTLSLDIGTVTLFWWKWRAYIEKARHCFSVMSA